MRLLGMAGFLLVCWALPASAQVVLDQWGTYATVVSSDCANLCDPENDLSWFFGLTFEETNSGAMTTVIDATANVARGDAFAEASVASGLGPSVRVDANSAAASFMDGTATAIQGYTYVGVIPDTIDVDVNLTGTIGNPDGDPATGLAARVSYVGDANISTLVFENAVGGLLTPDDFVDLETNQGGGVSLSAVLSIPVSPGDQFYLIVSSAATAGGTGAFAESLSTLTTNFDPADTINLQPAGIPAGVPALGWAAATWLVIMLAAAGTFLGSRLRTTLAR
jgi:hypothetical protein